MNQTFNTPILFIIFNRPETTKRVFDEIRKVKPAQLFIAGDGPRENNNSDIEKCKITREIVGNIDWPCEIKTLFREKNLGCKTGVSSAIDWFFQHVESGIILEDDCLPNQSFFPFCEELLTKYRNEEKIMMISGFNIHEIWKTDSSYFYSKYGSIWGWATWNRAWKLYDVTMNSWFDEKNKKQIRKNIGKRWQWKIKEWSYNKTAKGEKDTWDYQWEYARILNSGLSIIPTYNLVKNIGINIDATHSGNIELSQIKTRNIEFPIVHTTIMQADENYDSLFIQKIFQPKTFFELVIIKLKKIFK